MFQDIGHIILRHTEDNHQDISIFFQKNFKERVLWPLRSTLGRLHNCRSFPL
jgi:dihydroorotase